MEANNWIRWQNAYHEAAHAIVAELLFPGSVNFVECPSESSQLQALQISGGCCYHEVIPPEATHQTLLYRTAILLAGEYFERLLDVSSEEERLARQQRDMRARDVLAKQYKLSDEKREILEEQANLILEGLFARYQVKELSKAVALTLHNNTRIGGEGIRNMIAALIPRPEEFLVEIPRGWSH